VASVIGPTAAGPRRWTEATVAARRQCPISRRAASLPWRAAAAPTAKTRYHTDGLADNRSGPAVN